MTSQQDGRSPAPLTLPAGVAALAALIALRQREVEQLAAAAARAVTSPALAGATGEPVDPANLTPGKGSPE